MTMSPKIDERNRQLAELAWSRFRTAIAEGKSEKEAFTDTMIALLEVQDEAWLQGFPSQGEA